MLAESLGAIRALAAWSRWSFSFAECRCTDIEQATAYGTITDYGRSVVPHWDPQECSDLYPGVVSDMFAGSEPRLQPWLPGPPGTTSGGPLPRGASIIIPLALTMGVGVEFGPHLAFDRVEFLDVDNVAIGEMEVRQRFVTGSSSLSNLASSIGERGC